MDSISCLCIVLSILPLHLMEWILHTKLIRRIDELEQRAGNEVQFFEDLFLDLENTVETLGESLGVDWHGYHEPGDDDFEEQNT